MLREIGVSLHDLGHATVERSLQASANRQGACHKQLVGTEERGVP